MAINKVIYGNQTLIDITDSTVSEQNMVLGVTAYNKAGVKITGTLDVTNIVLLTYGEQVSFSDILDAYENGKLIYARYNNLEGYVPLNYCITDESDNIIKFSFISIDVNWYRTFMLDDNDTWSSTVDLSVSPVDLALPFNSSNSYTTGDYIYENEWFRYANKNISSGSSYSDNDWNTTRVGDELKKRIALPGNDVPTGYVLKKTASGVAWQAESGGSQCPIQIKTATANADFVICDLNGNVVFDVHNSNNNA